MARVRSAFWGFQVDRSDELAIHTAGHKSDAAEAPAKCINLWPTKAMLLSAKNLHSAPASHGVRDTVKYLSDTSGYSMAKLEHKRCFAIPEIIAAKVPLNIDYMDIKREL